MTKIIRIDEKTLLAGFNESVCMTINIDNYKPIHSLNIGNVEHDK